jgi:histidinol-phosphate aminotransferase
VACDLPGATILAPLPGFVMYEMSARLQGLQLRRRAADGRLRARRSGDAGGHRAAPPALTYIAYPNNPTANLFDDAVIDRIVDAVGAPARPGGVRRGLPALRRRAAGCPPGGSTRTCW